MAVFWGVFFSCVLYIRSSQSEGRTSLNDVSAVVRRKEGWTDSRLYLSLINLSDGVEKWLYLINKRDTAYAFPRKLSSGPQVRRCEEGHRCRGLDGGRAVELGLTKVTRVCMFCNQLRVWFVMVSSHRNLPEYLLVVKCFVFQDFL